MPGRKFYNGVDVVNQKVVNLADGSAATDAVTKQQLDAAIRGISWKSAARAASTTNVTLATPGASIDGVTLVSGDRVLLKNQTTGSENGIYVWTGASALMTRALDNDSAVEMVGAAVYITEGTVNGDKAFTQTVDPFTTLGTTVPSFSQFGGGGTVYTAGNGLSLTSSTFAVIPGSGILADGSSTRIDPSVVVRKYAANIGGSTTIAVTHSLGTKDITYALQVISTGEFVDTDAVATDTNTLTLTFATAPGAASLRVIVQA